MLREPLLHFLVLGAGLFLLFRLASGPDAPPEDQIVVTAGKIENLVELFSRVRQRPPTATELEGLIQEHILEEVLYREAKAMGLDEDDTIIRRRLRQKMEFLIDDFASQEPSDEELLVLLESSPEQFQRESTISFEHVFFRQGADHEATALLAELEAGAEIAVTTAGHRLPLPSVFDDSPEREISALFGAPFKEALWALDTGSWIGPVPSPFGLHLVYVSERIQGRVPALDEIREKVAREWLSARRRAAQKVFFEQLRSQYAITVERPGVTLSESTPR
jgi:hypothetical protein